MFQGRTKEQEELVRRARRPYVFRNTLTGLGIMGFVLGVYTYSMLAVKQEDFDDLDIKNLSSNNTTDSTTEPSKPNATP
ncbi:hypothetical protein IWQ62_003233 [Dispira parvispora]|uniref:Cytochrome c oxidase assembly factor 3 n=1 Tax=Dispira parvispora TaxID=1520584 RepID=A0A9W8E787_9FUNG|nr:hypothetical protein IWQ62_003233 [Dispira parvispora]